MKRVAGVALAALFLAPIALAAGPAPQPWSPYNAVSEVRAIAMAREGTAIAAALAPPTTTAPGGQLPSQDATAPCGELPGAPPPPDPVPVDPPTAPEDPRICTDLTIAEFGTGFARNGTVEAPRPLGRSHVAVSRDGNSIATLGLDGPGTESDVVEGEDRFVNRTLQFLRIPSGSNWTGTPYARTLKLGPSTDVLPVGLAVSDDGRRVLALTTEGTQYVLRGWTFGGSSLDSAFELRAPGTARALAAAGDMSRILVAGQFTETNFTYGGGYILPFGQGEPLSSFFDRSANNTDVVSASISRDGMTLAMGSADGRAHVFRAGSLNFATTFNVSSGPLNFTKLSEDGTRLAAVQNMTLTHFDTTEATPRALWNATVPGTQVTGVALNATGAIVLASSVGTGGALVAYDEGSNAPLWTLPGQTRAVAIDAAGTRVAYGQGAVIGAARLPRALTMDLAAGGKVAAEREITIPGTQTYEVSLRNDGAAVERVVIEEGAPEISVTTEPRIIAVRPGSITRVNVTVGVDQPLPGPRVFNITARALTSGLVDNVTLSLTPRPTLDVKLVVNETDILAEAGKASEVLLTIVNNGTSDAPVALRALQTVSSGALWDLQLSETSLTALRGTRTSVRLGMTPPADVGNGTSSTVQITLEGQDIFDTARITFRVNPDLKVEVNATGVTKFIEPGKDASYNVTVTNTGSLPREFEVFYTITESSGRSWGVDMSSATVRLDPLAKRTFAVKIVAPADAQPNERVSVLVSARSIPERVNETPVIDNVTLFGVAVPLKIPTPTTPDNGIPFVAPVFAITAVALLAAIIRRRRAQ